MYAKLFLALCAIGLSLYGRQAESVSPTAETPRVSSSPQIPALKPIQGVYIDWKDRMIHAVGTGQAGENADPAVQRLLAIRAAHVDALRKLASVVYGLHIDPLRTVDDRLAPTDDNTQKIRIKVEGLIKGAKAVSDPEAQPDGAYKEHLIMPLADLETALSLSDPLSKQ